VKMLNYEATLGYEISVPAVPRETKMFGLAVSTPA